MAAILVPPSSLRSSPPPLSSLNGTFSSIKPSSSSKFLPITAARLSSTTPPVVAAEDDQQQDPPPAEAAAATEDSQFRGCKTCGKEEIEKGCNGEGRIQGGIATVPGFGWWPIKAFRPCPGFSSSGGRYKRRGQSMDEVTSGRGKKVS